MLPSVNLPLILAAGVSAAAFLCPLCGGGIQPARAQDVTVATPAPDTAMVRLHISRMTCGSCPTTARLALKRLAGVYSASVTLDDSLGGRALRCAEGQPGPDRRAPDSAHRLRCHDPVGHDKDLPEPRG